MSTHDDGEASYLAVMVPPKGALLILDDAGHRELRQAQLVERITGYKASHEPQLIHHTRRGFCPTVQERNPRSAGLARALNLKLGFEYGPKIFLFRNSTENMSPFRSNSAESWRQPLPDILQDCLDNGWTSTQYTDFQEFISSPAWWKERD